MQTIVVKFGGSSLADAAQFKKVADIIHAKTARRFVVASAPGKRNDEDTKVTDLLYCCYDLATDGQDFEPVLAQIEARFREIVDNLKIDFDLDAEIEVLREHLKTSPQSDYMASRGEYLNSKIMAKYLGFRFLDAAKYICFDKDGQLDAEKTNAVLAPALLASQRAVIPGFYGAYSDGTIHTFSRGGSDITGSIVARAVGADIYENWTDVSGMLVADPRIVDNPKPIARITYKELRELSYMGASVLHEDAVFPARAAGIPINIRNTNHPEDPGTMIVRHNAGFSAEKVITGIAGTKGFSSILIEKAMMNSEIGFGAKVLGIFADYGISFEYLPSGIDTMSVIVSTAQLANVRDELLRKIIDTVHPDAVFTEDELAIIAVVGHGMVSRKGVAARALGAISKANINIRMIDQGSSELNIIIGVSDSDCEDAIRTLYAEFEPEL